MQTTYRDTVIKTEFNNGKAQHTVVANKKVKETRVFDTMQAAMHYVDLQLALKD